jgi:HTH-type transcriptional regulator/antitoxin HigA
VLAAEGADLLYLSEHRRRPGAGGAFDWPIPTEGLAHLDRFEQAAVNIEARPGKRTKLERLELDAVRSQAADLRAELDDYDELRTGNRSTFDAPSLEELATVLVKARIARGWTQRQLAEALGMAEQQIQRYEANDYRSTSLARLCDIANALGVTIAQHAEFNTSAA